MKNLFIRNISLVMGLLMTTSCAVLRSVSMTQVPIDRSHPIESEAFTWGIFGIYFSNSFTDQAIDQLRDKCPNGKIVGVYTKFESKIYFIWTTRTIKAKAFCEAGSKT